MRKDTVVELSQLLPAELARLQISSGLRYAPSVHVVPDKPLGSIQLHPNDLPGFAGCILRAGAALLHIKWCTVRTTASRTFQHVCESIYHLQHHSEHNQPSLRPETNLVQLCRSCRGTCLTMCCCRETHDAASARISLAEHVDVRVAPVRGETVVILGGGMTAAHLACAALEHGAAQVSTISAVSLCSSVSLLLLPPCSRSFLIWGAGGTGVTPHVQEARIRSGPNVLW
jgi:hypothetical protein